MTLIVQATTAAAAAASLQSCLTLCDPIDSSPPGSPVPGILQARTLEWVAISFSSAWKWKVKVKSLSHVRLFSTPWTAAYQALLSMGFSRQEHWSGLPSSDHCQWLISDLRGNQISVMSDSAALWTVAYQALCPWNFPCMIIGESCHFLLKGIFPTQESNLCLLCLLH